MSRAGALAPGRGWAELGAAWSSAAGVRATAEAGWRFAPQWSVYGSGYAGKDYGVGVGVRGEW